MKIYEDNVFLREKIFCTFMLLKHWNLLTLTVENISWWNERKWNISCRMKMKNANETFWWKFFPMLIEIFQRISAEFKIKLFHFLAFQHSFGCCGVRIQNWITFLMPRIVWATLRTKSRSERWLRNGAKKDQLG